MKRAWLVIAAIALFFAIAAAWIVTDTRASRHVYDDSSAANTSDSGLSFAFAYLRQQQRAATLHHDLTADRVAANATVFRVGEAYAPLIDEKPGEEKGGKRAATPILSEEERVWVERGGRLVLAMKGDIGDLASSPRAGATAVKTFPFVAGIDTLFLPERRGFTRGSLPPRMVALYVSQASVIVARERIGAGEVYVIAVPEIFQNAHLRSGNHLPLLVALAGAGRPVLFDETIHGLADDEGALELMKEWRLGPFLLLLLATALLIFWRGARRIGPPDEDRIQPRSEAVDVVASLARLYRHSTSDAEALAQYEAAFTRMVAAQTGLRGDALQRRAASLLGRPLRGATGGRISTDDFKRELAVLNAAFDRLRPLNSASEGSVRHAIH